QPIRIRRFELLYNLAEIASSRPPQHSKTRSGPRARFAIPIGLECPSRCSLQPHIRVRRLIRRLFRSNFKQTKQRPKLLQFNALGHLQKRQPCTHFASSRKAATVFQFAFSLTSEQATRCPNVLCAFSLHE